jgi:hypothetical protein
MAFNDLITLYAGICVSRLLLNRYVICISGFKPEKFETQNNKSFGGMAGFGFYVGLSLPARADNLVQNPGFESIDSSSGFRFAYRMEHGQRSKPGGFSSTVPIQVLENH